LPSVIKIVARGGDKEDKVAACQLAEEPAFEKAKS
jgi:hypothetical protein